MLLSPRIWWHGSSRIVSFVGMASLKELSQTMAPMKANELREMQTAELTSKLADLKAELFNLRFQHAINQLENPGRIEAVKKDIARVMTVLAEKQ